MTNLQKNRDACVLTGAKDLEVLYTFKKFPVFMGCINESEDFDLKEDMIWSISASSGLIQLKQLLPLDILYAEEHGAGVVGALWLRHHREFAEFISQYSPKTILEVGGGHGILAKEYMHHDQIPWVIVEPNPAPVENCPAQFVKGFFNEQFQHQLNFDTVVHSHVLEHMYEPNLFMKHLSSFMNLGNFLIFSLPNMEEMLKRKYNNCINFEHTIYLTEPYVEFLLKKHGFEIIEKKYFLEDHSIFYAAVKCEQCVDSPEINKNLYMQNKAVFNEYINHYDSLAKELNMKIESFACPVFLFGAHIFSQYLLGFGLNENLIDGILDNDLKKQGKRLYGSKLDVFSPDVIRGIAQPVVILRAGAYNAEIKHQVLSEINPATIFI